MPGAVLGHAQDRGAVLCHAQDELRQPLEQRATGRSIHRFSGTDVILFTSPLSDLKDQRAAVDVFSVGLTSIRPNGCFLVSPKGAQSTRDVCVQKHLRPLNQLALPAIFYLFSISETSFTKLCTNSARRNSHDYRLHSADFIIRYPLFFGHAKVMLHSRITTDRHRCSQVNQERRLGFQDFIVECRIVEISIGLLLFLR